MIHILKKSCLAKSFDIIYMWCLFLICSLFLSNRIKWWTTIWFIMNFKCRIWEFSTCWLEIVVRRYSPMQGNWPSCVTVVELSIFSLFDRNVEIWLLGSRSCYLRLLPPFTCFKINGLAGFGFSVWDPPSWLVFLTGSWAASGTAKGLTSLRGLVFFQLSVLSLSYCSLSYLRQARKTFIASSISSLSMTTISTFFSDPHSSSKVEFRLKLASKFNLFCPCSFVMLSANSLCWGSYLNFEPAWLHT